MVTIPVQCPDCHRLEVIKAGRQPNRAQRYWYQNPDCERAIFLLSYGDKGRQPQVKTQIVEMAMNGSPDLLMCRYHRRNKFCNSHGLGASRLAPGGAGAGVEVACLVGE